MQLFFVLRKVPALCWKLHPNGIHQRLGGMATGGVQLPEHTGEALGDVTVDALCGDLLALCLDAARDTRTLARAAAVCRSWCAVAVREDLWEQASRRRWRLQRRKGKFKFGERSWRDVYVAFHRMGRMPSLEGVSARQVIYAQGSRSQVCGWLLVQHEPACRLVLPVDGGPRYLGAPRRLLVMYE